MLTCPKPLVRLSVVSCFLLALSACADFRQIIRESPDRPGAGVLPAPVPLDRDRRQITLDAQEFTAVVEARFRSGDNPLCGIGVPGGGLGYNADEYFRDADSPDPGSVWVGYVNSARASQERRGIRDRCEDRLGATYHAIAEFDGDLLRRIFDQVSRTRGETVVPRVISATLRAERQAEPVDRSGRCVIGRRAPLASAVYFRAPITVIDGPVGVTVLEVARGIIAPEDRPDLEIVQYRHRSYAGDGRRFTMGIADYYSQQLHVALFEEERDEDGATLFLSANSAGLEALNERFRRGEFDSVAASLFSITNSQYGTNNDCLAVYGNIRLNLEYELLPAR